MGLETAALIAAGVGTAAQAAGGYAASSAANKRQAGITRAATGMMENGPSGVEQSLSNFGDMFNVNSSFNGGQDALLQMLRAKPWAQQGYADDRLRAASAATPFNLTDQFAAFRDTANQNITDQVNQLHAGVGSMGRRFGTGTANAEALLRARGVTGLNQTVADLSNSAFESAQNRGLSAAQIAGNLGVARGQLGVSAAGQASSAGLAQLQMMLQALTSQGQMAQNRRQGNINLLGITAGQPAGQNPYQSFGEGTTGLATLLYLMGNKSPAGGGAGAAPAYTYIPGMTPSFGGV
jgi:hypothetical protein